MDNWKKVNCSAGETCFKQHLETESGIKVDSRGCASKEDCQKTKELCKNGKFQFFKTDDNDDEDDIQIKDCAIGCCVSDGDIPCNGAFVVSANPAMMMLMVTMLSIVFNFV